jgi:PAS domain S-box-containing protein
MSEKKGGTIMVVDDEPVILENIASLLRNRGYTVVACRSGNEALANLEEHDITVLLTDVRMPSPSGLEILERVHGLRPEVPVILMTAYAEFDLAIEAIKKGAFDFVVKPYRGVHLLHTVEKAVKYKTFSELERDYTRTLEQTVQKRTQELAGALAMVEREKNVTDSIFQSLSSGLMVLDMEGRIITVNQAGTEILRLFSDTIESRRLSDVLGPEAAAEIIALQDETSDAASEVRVRTREDQEIIIGCSTVRGETIFGEQGGLVVSFKDITEMKAVEREMERMNRLSTVAEIASAVAHEVRNPLAGIKTMAQSIEENLDTEDENMEYISRILKQVDRLNTILKEFFNYARPSRPRKERTSLVDIIRAVLPLVKKKLESKGMVLREDYDFALPSLLVDPNQMQQVFLNLLLNAVDAIPGNGDIGISARVVDEAHRNAYGNVFPQLKASKNYLLVLFRDSGPGMPGHVVEKVFEPFFTTKPTGTGLGLSIVYRILRENNAAIFVDSTEGAGTVFTMFLPTE